MKCTVRAPDMYSIISSREISSMHILPHFHRWIDRWGRVPLRFIELNNSHANVYETLLNQFAFLSTLRNAVLYACNIASAYALGSSHICSFLLKVSATSLTDL